MSGTMKKTLGRMAAVTAAIAVSIVVLPPMAARADFRNARMGPRPRAMGSAFVSVADDANAVYWNPSGMTQLDRFELTGCRTLLYAVDGLSNDYVSLAYNRAGLGAFGMSWVRLGLKDVYYEDSINLALARKLPFMSGLSIGASLKVLVLSAPGYEKYNDPAYEGRDIKETFDFGVHYRSAGAWTLGAVVYNVTEPKLKLLSTTTEPAPVHRETAIGASYTFRGMLLTTFDLRTRYGSFSNTIGRFGSELWFFDAVALRGGFERGNMTAGLGLNGGRWQFDVMFETHDELGNTYQFSGTVRL
jgi:hypothetical protein